MFCNSQFRILFQCSKSSKRNFTKCAFISTKSRTKKLFFGSVFYTFALKNDYFYSKKAFCHSTMTNEKLNICEQEGNKTGNGFLSSEKFQEWQWLSKLSPGFPLNGSQIKIILGPEEFYSTLINKISKAKNRISLASLYLGNGELENGLVRVIQNNLESNKDLKVKILLDYTRGSRGQDNSRTMLLPLVQKSLDNCQVFLYHTPTLRGLIKKWLPQRWNEIIGLQHMKIYLFDNSLLISGANLSNDYFTNRQDRYFLIEDVPDLTNFFDGLIDKVCHFSFKMDQTNQVNLNPNWNIHPSEGEQNKFVNEANNLVSSYYEEWKKDNDKRLTSEIKNNDKEHHDTWIFPLIQMGPININYDNSATNLLLQRASKKTKIKLATGYFNLTPQYIQKIIDSNADFDILMAHPTANGFLGTKFPMGGIPAAYTLLGKKFLNQVKEASQSNRINLWEYSKSKWTFHAKGLWFYPSQESSLPTATLIGSPNFGYRSVYRDLETQLYIISTNDKFQNQLDNEQKNLYSKSTHFNESTLLNRDRLIPLWVKMVILIFRNFF